MSVGLSLQRNVGPADLLRPDSPDDPRGFQRSWRRGDKAARGACHWTGLQGPRSNTVLSSVQFCKRPSTPFFLSSNPLHLNKPPQTRIQRESRTIQSLRLESDGDMFVTAIPALNSPPAPLFSLSAFLRKQWVQDRCWEQETLLCVPEGSPVTQHKMQFRTQKLSSQKTLPHWVCQSPAVLHKSSRNTTVTPENTASPDHVVEAPCPLRALWSRTTCEPNCRCGLTTPPPGPGQDHRSMPGRSCPLCCMPGAGSDADTGARPVSHSRSFFLLSPLVSKAQNFGTVQSSGG